MMGAIKSIKPRTMVQGKAAWVLGWRQTVRKGLSVEVTSGLRLASNEPTVQRPRIKMF